MRDAKRHSASFINFFLTLQLKYDDVQFAILNGVVPVARTRSFNAALSSVARRVEAQTAHFVLTDTAAQRMLAINDIALRDALQQGWSLASFISKKQLSTQYFGFGEFDTCPSENSICDANPAFTPNLIIRTASPVCRQSRVSPCAEAISISLFRA